VIRDFVKEGTIYTIAGFLAKGVSLLLIPLFTTYFSPRDYGVLDLLFVFSMFFHAFFSLQIGQGLTRFIGEAHLDQEKQRKIASTSLFIVLVGYLIGTFIALIYQTELMNLLGLTHPSYKKSYVLALLSLGANGLYFFFSAHLQALRRKTAVALSSFLHAFLGITGTYFFVLVLDKGLNGVFYATLAIVPIVLLCQFIILKKEYVLFFSRKLYKQLVQYSSPLIPAAIAYVVLSLTDRLFINHYLDKSQLGVYSIGFKFSMVITMIITGFSMALGPIVYQWYGNEKLKDYLSILFNWFLYVGLFVVIALSLFSEETVWLFTHAPYFGASRVMPMLYFSVWFSGLSMFSLGMNIKHKNRWTPVIVISSAFLNCVLNYYLIPIYGIVGASLATLISCGFNYVLLFMLSRKYYPFPINRYVIAIGILITTAFILLASESIYSQLIGDLRIRIKLIVLLLFISGFIFLLKRNGHGFLLWFRG
jgi:O-antigen/teichoic acid export membrane protein